MNGKQITLAQLSRNQKARIIRLDGGRGFQRKLRLMGIREGQIAHIISRQPLSGPLTIAVGKNEMTMGRGMANKITVEAI